MSASEVSAQWNVVLRPTYEVRPDCGEVELERSPIAASVVFTPRWELRIDVAANGRVRQIAFGTRAAVRLLEGCA
jgi:hypothetical protein